MPTCYQLVGVPGSGKSTWVQSQKWIQDLVIVSTDQFIEEEAVRQGLTYNDVFDQYMPTAIKLMIDLVNNAREAGKDIIWDQTSTTVKSRSKKFNLLKSYKHIAVVFPIPEETELKRRLASRPGKNIPWNHMNSMITGFTVPSESEGFTEIWYT